MTLWGSHQFQLVCNGCPPNTPKGHESWKCQQCYYKHPEPVADPFYQSTVKSLVSFCAVVLLFVRITAGHRIIVPFTQAIVTSSLT